MDATRSELTARVLARLKALSAELLIADMHPVAQGEQNLVFSCRLRGEKSILKVTDSRHRSREALETQVAMLAALEHHAANVCAPLHLTGDPVFETDIAGRPFYLVAYPYAPGEHVEITRHGHLMGTVLAELHAAMRRLPQYAFAEIGAGDNLARVETAARTLGLSEQTYAEVLEPAGSGVLQLLHGDFNAVNVKLDGPTVNVFDFDNCVYGVPAYELANSLYMVLFDEVRRGEADARYRTFHQDFLAGYGQAGAELPREALIDAFISYRVLLLASWLLNPDDAPLFIRQASSSWLNTLQTFVQVYLGRVQAS